MANAMLFYRTEATKKSNPTYANPDNLPPGQKLLFTPPDQLARFVDDDYRNNIVRQVPALTGGRRILQTDQGAAGWIINLEGDYVKGTANDGKIYDFATNLQYDAYHEFGNVGLKYPNGSNELQLIDPTDTMGLMIERKRGKHVGITKELVDFGITLSFGGDLPYQIGIRQTLPSG